MHFEKCIITNHQLCSKPVKLLLIDSDTSDNLQVSFPHPSKTSLLKSSIFLPQHGLDALLSLLLYYHPSNNFHLYSCFIDKETGFLSLFKIQSKQHFIGKASPGSISIIDCFFFSILYTTLCRPLLQHLTYFTVFLSLYLNCKILVCKTYILSISISLSPGTVPGLQQIFSEYFGKVGRQEERKERSQMPTSLERGFKGSKAQVQVLRASTSAVRLYIWKGKKGLTMIQRKTTEMIKGPGTQQEYRKGKIKNVRFLHFDWKIAEN